MPDQATPGHALLPTATPPADAGDRLVLVGAAALALPFAFLGFGTDVDTYLVLECGQRLLDGGGYVPSRNPGYFAFEMATLALDRLGGSLACDLVTVAASLVAVAFFLRLARAYGVEHRKVWAACLVVHPSWWIFATSTAEPVWSVAAVLAGWSALVSRRWAGAAVLLGLAVALRHQATFSVGPLLLFAWVALPGRRRAVFLTGAAAVAVALPFYLPAFRAAGWSLSFLSGHMDVTAPNWTPVLWVGRFAYKSVWFWGVPAAFVIAAILLASRSRLRTLWTTHRLLILLLVTTVAAHHLLFLRYPFKKTYLLYALPPMLLLLALARGRHAASAWALAAALALQGLVSLELARPDVARDATGATLGVWLTPGDLVRDAQLRRELLDCRDTRCWRAVIDAHPR